MVGIAYTKDLIRAERAGDGDTSVQELVREVRFVPENKPLRQLMREMQAGKFHLALVADEYGAHLRAGHARGLPRGAGR